MPATHILLSGGSGLLGTTLVGLDPDIASPPRSEMDVTEVKSVTAALKKYQPKVFIHAAALTSPPHCDEHPTEAIESNIIGTANVVMACADANVRLVYISTDYVFKGDRGNYSEDDELQPQNLYAWTKLGGECAVQAYKDSLIIRTTFSPDEFPYDKAFTDQYTSRDGVSVIAPLILDAAKRSDVTGVLHVGTERKTVKELAIKLGKADVGDLTRADVPFEVPCDTSLDTSRLERIRNAINGEN